MGLILASFAILAALAAAFAIMRQRRASRRRQALSRLLDAADGMEAQLRAARSEIEAIAGTAENPVREAMQEMLRQRLWVQQHGAHASLDQLDAVRRSIDAARGDLDRQLLQVERARAALH